MPWLAFDGYFHTLDKVFGIADSHGLEATLMGAFLAAATEQGRVGPESFDNERFPLFLGSLHLVKLELGRKLILARFRKGARNAIHNPIGALFQEL